MQNIRITVRCSLAGAENQSVFLLWLRTSRACVPVSLPHFAVKIELLGAEQAETGGSATGHRFATLRYRVTEIGGYEANWKQISCSGNIK